MQQERRPTVFSSTYSSIVPRCAGGGAVEGRTADRPNGGAEGGGGGGGDGGDGGGGGGGDGGSGGSVGGGGGGEGDRGGGSDGCGTAVAAEAAASVASGGGAAAAVEVAVTEAAVEAAEVAWAACNARGSQYGHSAGARTGWACGSRGVKAHRRTSRKARRRGPKPRPHGVLDPADLRQCWAICGSTRGARRSVCAR